MKLYLPSSNLSYRPSCDLQTKEKELMGLSKAVNETRSRMDLAQSELDIYLSRHNTALTQLNTAKQTLDTTSNTLRERRAAIKDLEVKIPQIEQELKKVTAQFMLLFGILCDFFFFFIFQAVKHVTYLLNHCTSKVFSELLKALKYFSANKYSTQIVYFLINIYGERWASFV